MTRNHDIALAGSVQEKNGRLHLVYPHCDPISGEIKKRWKAMGLPAGTKKSVVEKRRREMLTELEKEEARAREGLHNPDAYPLVEFLNTWLDEVHSHKVQESTLRTYKYCVNGKIAKHFGDKFTLGDVRPHAVHTFYDTLRSEGDSERTILHYHNLLHAAFEYAIRQEIIEFNPTDRIERPKAGKFVGSFYSVEEVKQLLAIAENDPLYIPIVLAAFYSVRRSEALGLSWDSIDFEQKFIYIRRKVVEVNRKGKLEAVVSDVMKNETSRRTLPLIPEVEEILLRHKAEQEKHRQAFGKGYAKAHVGMVCLDPLGNLIRPNYVTEHFAYMLGKNGLRKIRFHDLRHTCASLLLSQDVNMKVIQMWLGHSSMKTTSDIYAHLDVSAKEKAGEILTHLLGADGESED